MSENSILSRLDGLKIKYEEIGQQMTDPEVIADMKKFVALNKEYKELQPVVETSEKYRTALNHLAEWRSPSWNRNSSGWKRRSSCC